MFHVLSVLRFLSQPLPLGHATTCITGAFWWRHSHRIRMIYITFYVCVRLSTAVRVLSPQTGILHNMCCCYILRWRNSTVINEKHLVCCLSPKSFISTWLIHIFWGKPIQQNKLLCVIDTWKGIKSRTHTAFSEVVSCLSQVDVVKGRWTSLHPEMMRW